MMSNLIKLFILFISACVLNIQQAVAVETVYHQCETEIARSQPDNVQLSSFTNLDVLFKLQKPFIKSILISQLFFSMQFMAHAYIILPLSNNDF